MAGRDKLLHQDIYEWGECRVLATQYRTNKRAAVIVKWTYEKSTT